ncbi:MAG: hypothetical protein II345_03830, partial [Alistipes sp.]|nr:hypothetical protein [Alistipes sp.]
MGIKAYIASLPTIDTERLCVTEPIVEPRLALNPASLEVEVAEGASLRLLVVHDTATTSALKVRLACGARLEMVEYFSAEAFVEVEVEQAAESRLKL